MNRASRLIFIALPTAVLTIFSTLQGNTADTARKADRTKQANAGITQPGDVHVESSRVYVFVGKSGLIGHDHAIEGRIQEGHIDLSKSTQVGKIVINMGSFAADTEAARRRIGLKGTTDADTQREVNANMLGKDVLDVAHHPTATFEIESARPSGEKSKRGRDQYVLSGHFTLHGVKRPLELVVEAEPRNAWIYLQCRFDIRQTDFGITPFSKAFGAVGVADTLRIWGDVWALGNGQNSQAAAKAVTRTR